MPGAMTWEEMDWLFPDFGETGLVYHGTRTEYLPSILREGLVPGKPKDGHETIYEALARHRPASVPSWVDPTHCIFGYMNRKRFPANRTQAIIGIRAEDSIITRTWVALSAFSNWLYCPREAGYFDTETRAKFYRRVVEPVCARAYWDMSLSFQENLSVRHDQLLKSQECQELLLCLARIDPDLLSLQALAVPGHDPILREASEALFGEIEAKLRDGQDASPELQAVHRCAEEVGKT